MSFCKLNEDTLTTIIIFLGAKSSVIFWISLPCVNRLICKYHPIWMKLLESYIFSYDILLEDALYRVGHMKEQSGIVILQMLHNYKKCFRNGCLKVFKEIHNQNSSCKYHNGKKNLITKQLTCCRALSFDSEGCCTSFHCGRTFDAIKFNNVKEEKLPAIIPAINNIRLSTDSPKLSYNNKSLSLPQIIT